MCRTWVAAVRGLMVCCLLAALSGCGGGGAQPPAPSQSDSQQEGSWQAQRLGTWTNNLSPGNTYQPIGGEVPYAFWLGSTGANQALNVASPASSSRGMTTTQLMDSLPMAVSSNTTIAVRAGSWSMLTWTESTGTMWQNLFVRVKGPSFDSGAVQVSSQFLGSAWDVRLVLDAAGNARAYWDEDSRLGANGRFSAGAWVPQADVGDSLAYLQRYLVGPDGQGWLFGSIDGGANHEVRRITAAGGLGGSQILSGPGALSSQRLASAEGPTNFLTVAYQSSGGNCFLIRRMVNEVLQPELCLAVDGASQPNQNYVSLASDASGRAVLVWSVGVNDQALYVARRSLAGVWSEPTKLVDLPTDSIWSLLSGLKTAMGLGGQALVVYRAQATSLSAGTVWALVAQDGGAWSAARELRVDAGENRVAAIAINAAGVPGVLQLTTQGVSASVLMSTWDGDAWTTRALRSNTQLSYLNSTLLSSARLAPAGTHGWLAVWDEGDGLGSSDGYREVWAAEYR